MKSLYEKIGHDFIEKAITEFYNRAFSDVIIGHFFLGKDQKHITKQQIDFASSMLGAENIHYKGVPLKKAHTPFLIRPPHFKRRQVIMREVLSEMKLDNSLAEAWLSKEDQLKPLIFSSPFSCRE